MSAGRLGVAAVAIAVSACGGGISVNSDWDPAIDFAGYRTFAVLDEASGEPLPAFTDQRVKSSIASVLTSKGMEQVDNPDNADVAVGYQFTSEQRSSYQTVNTGWGGYGYGGYGGWYGGGMSVGTSTTTERRYEVGSLVIAVFDTEMEQMVYASTGSKTLEDRQMTPEESQARIDEAVQTILRDFPPGS
jgi:hypothetical protein